MLPFEVVRPGDAVAASRVATQPEASFLAGGTNLIDYMKLDVLAPHTLVDVNRLPLAGIEIRADRLRLGALTRMSDAADDPRVRSAAPAIAQALAASASRQLRNMASLGGNVLQRTRCPYFRDTAMPCNKRRPGSGCGARTGSSEDHAILGTSPLCIAVHASDFAVPLVAFDAVIRVQAGGVERAVSVHDFFLPPGTAPERETPLAAGDLIVGIDVPTTAAAARSTYLKVRERTSYAFALASCAAGIERAPDGRLRDVRIALGGVGTIPWRARVAEERLRGTRGEPSEFLAAARAVFVEAQPTTQNAYKIDLGVATIVRALETVTA